MNIVVASDENYVPHLETLVVSIGETNHKIESIKIHIFDGGISERSKQEINQFKNRFKNMELKFYKMTEKIIADRLGGRVAQDRSLTTFARIFIPEIITDEKAIYLDVDAVVLQDLSGLYQLDMEGFAIAGVRDTNPISRHRNVGLDDNEPYINSGMILWNLKKCREIRFIDQCKDFIRLYNGNVDAMDQGTINGVLGKANLIKVIHPKYNVLTSMFQLKHDDILKFYGLNEYYNDTELKEAIMDPVFVHFTPNMTTRPWIEHCKHPKKDEYWRFRSKTEFSKKELDPDNRSLKLRIMGFIYRNFPISIFLVLMKFFKQLKSK